MLDRWLILARHQHVLYPWFSIASGGYLVGEVGVLIHEVA